MAIHDPGSVQKIGSVVTGKHVGYYIMSSETVDWFSAFMMLQHHFRRFILAPAIGNMHVNICRLHVSAPSYLTRR